MYTDIKLEIDGLTDLVKSLDDEELVAEIHELCYDNENPVISDILHDFWYTGLMTETNRRRLESFYITAHVEEGYDD